jgi:hypothetical protein
MDIRIDSIGITASEFNELERLTLRHKGNIKAIFGVDSSGETFATRRNGTTPMLERIYVSGVSSILDRLQRSMARFRETGGRLFIDRDGAYWKTGRSPKNTKNSIRRMALEGRDSTAPGPFFEHLG